MAQGGGAVTTATHHHTPHTQLANRCSQIRTLPRPVVDAPLQLSALAQYSRALRVLVTRWGGVQRGEDVPLAGLEAALVEMAHGHAETGVVPATDTRLLFAVLLATLQVPSNTVVCVASRVAGGGTTYCCA